MEIIMSEIFFNGFGKQYLKPEHKSIRERYSAYSLVHIKDINKYLFIAPNVKIKEDFYKIIGGGIKKEENIQEALKREMLEECGYPLKDSFKEIKRISYKFNFKPMRSTDEYWYNYQTYILFEVDTLDESGFPDDTYWFSEEEQLPVHLLDKDYILDNKDNFHFTIQLAIENLIG